MPLTQASRFLNITTPLGEDSIFLTGFRGREEISRLFRFDLDLMSEDVNISPTDLVGKVVTFSLEHGEGERRHFNGYVSRFSAGPVGFKGRRQYRAEVVPWLWFLQRTSDCRIFQNLTAPQIIEKVFTDLGFTDFESHIEGGFIKRDYCVQYRETDFNFVSRLMEEEGIFYFFRHEDGKHTLVLGNSPSAYEECKEKEVNFPPSIGGYAINSQITGWDHRFEFRSGKWSQQDYNFETPFTSLATNTSSSIPLDGADKYEFYDYPGLYGNPGEGSPRTLVRMQEEEAGYDVVHASSNCVTFTPGGKFSIGEHHVPDEEGKKYVITGIYHTANETRGYETGAAPEEEYSNSFTCIPDTVVYRAPRMTPKPCMQGLQTAVVVGPPGEEIYTDKYGRIKVQFYWDREGKKDENSSCWVRVTHLIAGKGWGFMCIPRIGQEVVINFLEGDPDQPIVLGCVNNADQMPPWDLPGSMNQMCLRSNSTKGGDGYNELMFDDTAGKEMVFMHAQYDMNTHVKHDSRITVENDQDVTVGANVTVAIGANREETIGGNHVETVGKDMKQSVAANTSLTVGNNSTTSVGKNAALTIGENLAEKVGKNYDITIGGAHTEKVKKFTIESATDVNVKAKDIKISATSSITLKVGSSFIKIDSSGVTIKGAMINIQPPAGAAGEAEGASPESPEAGQEAKPKEPKKSMISKTGMKSVGEAAAKAVANATGGPVNASTSAAAAAISAASKAAAAAGK